MTFQIRLFPDNSNNFLYREVKSSWELFQFLNDAIHQHMGVLTIRLKIDGQKLHHPNERLSEGDSRGDWLLLANCDNYAGRGKVLAPINYPRKDQYDMEVLEELSVAIWEEIQKDREFV